MKIRAKLATIEQVSFEFREEFILTGYRTPNTDLKSCLQSIFYLNNETINFWTHFVPFVYVLFELSSLSIVHNLMKNDFMWPFFIYLFTVCFYLFMSSAAHMFNCYSSTARHICFILDYLSISIYGMGCTIAYKSYTIASMNMTQIKTQHHVFDRYIWLAMTLTVLANIVSCSTRFILTRNKRGLLRAGSFIVQYVFVNLPLLYRFLYFYCPQTTFNYDYFFAFLSSANTTTSIQSDVWLAYNQTSRAPVLITDENFFLLNFQFSNESDPFYVAQFVAAMVSAFLYVTHFPESVFPGRFDMIGSSHQIFHVSAFCTTWFQFKAIEADIRLLNESMNNTKQKYMNGADMQFNYTFIMMLCVFLNSLILIYYYVKASYFNPWLTEEEKTRKNETCKCFQMFQLAKSVNKENNNEKKIS